MQQDLSHCVYCDRYIKGVWPQGDRDNFFENLEEWAKENGVRRLELTVECRNQIARRLYEKSGFKIEGVREGSMLVEGAFIDEYYMAKIL